VRTFNVGRDIARRDSTGQKQPTTKLAAWLPSNMGYFFS